MDIFYALSAPTRRSIVEILSVEGRLSSTSIADRFRVSPPAISQQLKVLRDTGLVRMEKDGRRRMYDVDPHALKELDSWTGRMTGLWNGRLDRLEALLEKQKRTQKHGQKHTRIKKQKV
jgi:DNA-binding transcriptional ArsR family regulator